MNMNIAEQTDQIRDKFEDIKRELAKEIVGHDVIIRQLFICILCGGHSLIEGVPGLGKTLLVKTLANVLGLEFSRIQFTPDLMPADIIGTNIISEDKSGKRSFEFFKGPIFGQLVLADEVNRATPKTQSALLEAMQENRVTVFGTNYHLDLPFTVLATQNPIEMEGTYPLPEAQVDRFMLKLKIEYPNPTELTSIVEKTTSQSTEETDQVLNAEVIETMKVVVKQVPIAPHVTEYVSKLVLASHPERSKPVELVKNYVRYGASPRAAQAIVMGAKAIALLKGRYNVAIEDIKEVAIPAIRHRIILNLKGEAEGVNPDDIVKNILGTVPEN